ncbi:GPW/gp25 family protein [Nakamurella lactea]|jgi:phage baseplate assembly protein W|uniref:GPW/gp25 family protein n=1 Tax=Nakamurella lactea TaxID=459515 RepID=UPI0004291527|nr:GPW/gp25 family protein [Nakamurella lactea]
MDEIRVPATGATEAPHYDASFVGRGFYWPLQIDHTGSMRMTDGAADLDRSMAMVLATAPGERVMRPEFGCRIWELLFEPVTANLIGLMAQAVRDALAQWEPRVEIDDVDPIADPNDPALINISVTYRVKSTNDRRNLVFPFYVIPHEEG